MAIELADDLLDISDNLEQKRLYRFAEQLRGSAMSISNNIAEGAGSSSSKEFSHFLNIARRSTFETANILILLSRRDLIKEQDLEPYMEKLDHLCRRISTLRKSLNRLA